MNLLVLALLPWAGAVCIACLPPDRRRTAAWVAGGVALVVTALAVALAPPVLAGAVQRAALPWMPALGLALGVRLDALALMFVLLIGAIGALVVLYAAWYLDDEEPAPRFFALLLAFMGAMLGVVLADNLVLLAVAWELTSLASFLLVGWWHRRADAREGALMSLAVTGAGGLCLLAGLLLLGHMAGSLQLDDVLAAGDRVRAHPLYGTALALVLLGAFTKSAQFPFHFWLPQAMAAPTPASAYLHSATMVKAGVFLLARLYPVLAGTDAWFWSVATVGGATLLMGAWVALFQHDLKGLLAYSTISHLGLVMLLLGLDEPGAVVAALFHVINHATFKAGLFMAAGIIDHECGTRDMRRINGLMKLMPVTGLLGTVAAAAMAGVPLANGFLSKEMFFAEALAQPAHTAAAWLLPATALAAGIGSVAYSVRFVHDVFFNTAPMDLPRTPHEPPWPMRAPLALLALLCVAVGVAPQAIVGPLLAAASQAALQAPPPPYTLALWHGLNLPLMMSGLAVAGGLALYFGLQRRVNLHRVDSTPGVLARGRVLFRLGQQGALAAAGALTRAIGRTGLQAQTAGLALLALAAATWPLAGTVLPAPAWDGLPLPAALVGAVGLAAAVATVVLHRQRAVAVACGGAVGLVVCLAFAWFSAPDLALTQLLVETAGIVLLMLALRGLPERSPPEPRRPLHALVALACGGGLGLLAWAALGQPVDSIAGWYLAQALPQGGGGNVVNVIIVDFRGFDTLGEITVMGLAALVAHPLLADLRGRGAGPEPLVLRVVARALLPFAWLVAVYLYLRGHQLPGGGFVAGLVLAVAVFMHRLAEGLPAGGDLRGAIGGGLAVAAGTGLASWLFGAPFLTSTWDYPWLPGIGGVPLASASAFDLGVWIVVGAATLVLLLGFARVQGERP